jgi:uroporphyrin-III C-methyltransferase/precorrin-2 dehydrogenase/sirohydrochlorin ferrochelatase
MVIIGDAVAGANFELSEPLTRERARLDELARS